MSLVIRSSEPPPGPDKVNNSKTAQYIKTKFFKINLTPMGVILQIITFLINFRCYHGNLLLWNDFYTTSFWCQNYLKVKYPYITCRKCIWRHYDFTFCLIVLKTSIYFLLMTDFHHSKFGLIWIKKNKITEGAESPPPPGWECIQSPRWDRVKVNNITNLINECSIFTLVIDRNLTLFISFKSDVLE